MPDTTGLSPDSPLSGGIGGDSSSGSSGSSGTPSSGSNNTPSLFGSFTNDPATNADGTLNNGGAGSSGSSGSSGASSGSGSSLLDPVWELVSRGLLLFCGFLLVIVALIALLFDAKTVKVAASSVKRSLV